MYLPQNVEFSEIVSRFQQATQITKRIVEYYLENLTFMTKKASNAEISFE